MKIKTLFFAILLAAVIACGCLGCGNGSGASDGDSSDHAGVLADGTYQVDVTLEGGSGRAGIDSPAKIVVENGDITAEIRWSSSNYDYMIVDGEKYVPVNENGNSVFEIPVASMDEKLEVTADTTAMSKAHEITYTLYFDSSSVKPFDMEENSREEASEAEKGSGDGKALASGSGNTAGRTDISEIPKVEGLTYKETVSLDHAKCFRIYRYEGGYSVIRVDDGRDYLVVPDQGEVPASAEKEYIVLQRPLGRIYLAASAVMSLFDSMDAMESIRLSALDADDWYIENARTAMEEEAILFAGKYSEPDYELLLSENCDLAVESTMILHSPEVQEKLERLGIPVLIDRSSYEPDPLGRTEWIRLYGELTGRENEAERCFEEQKAYVEELDDFENTGKTVAFFYINDSGMVVTRKTSDYLPKMIEKAGGRYIFKELGDESSASSAVTMSMEEFYASAASADYLIYNAAIENPIDSVDELLEKSSLFADFKAVKNGNVWCTGKYLYQATSEIGNMIGDIHTMLTDDSVRELCFMKKLR